MRALSPEEAATLRSRPSAPMSPEVFEIAKRLVRRRCLRVEIVKVDGVLHERWWLTKLGALALRVALPTQAVPHV